MSGDNYATPPTEAPVVSILASRPHSDLDVVAGPMPTDPLRLDYALLKLRTALADRPLIGGGEPRGYLSVAAPPAVLAGRGVIVLQHPRGEPMKIDIGAVTEVGQTRFRHSVNTDRGSSGAPVLDAAPRLIGIHHAGHDNGPVAIPSYNQAIPLVAILADARTQGARVLKCFSSRANGARSSEPSAGTTTRVSERR